MTSKNSYDLIVIGSGPAGWTAALYASRANLKTLLFTGLEKGGIPGGQLMLTSEVENFPGFENGILGTELMDQMRRQAIRFGAEVIEEDVTRVDFSGEIHRVFTDSPLRGREEEYQAKAIVIATGASALWLGLESEARLRGRGVSSCATCDGFFFRGQEIAVIGGGDSALEEALFLTRFADKVTIVHRRNAFRASKILVNRAKANPRIAFAFNKEVAEIKGDSAVSGLSLRDTITGTISELPVKGVFVAIGHRPNTELFRGQIDLDADGYVVATENTKTSVPGVFVAGDVHDRRYRQAVTAAGEGCKAALDAEEYLTSEALEAPAPFVADVVIEPPALVAEEAPNPDRVTVYTTSWCPDCYIAKRYLDRLGVPYEEIDIEDTPGAAEQVEEWSGGYRTVPTFVIGDRIVVDFKRSELDAALAGLALASAD
jgi:thioredoxin reductase (NADPH)